MGPTCGCLTGKAVRKDTRFIRTEGVGYCHFASPRLVTTDSSRLELDAHVIDRIRGTVDDLTFDRPLAFTCGVDADAVEHYATALFKASRNTAF